MQAGMNLPISAWYTSRRPSATSPFLWLNLTGKEIEIISTPSITLTRESFDPTRDLSHSLQVKEEPSLFQKFAYDNIARPAPKDSP
jgi:hypothetical protein